MELGIVFLHIRAFQQSPQSLIGPLASLSALSLIPLGYVFLKETPSFLGLLGVGSIAVGPFFLGSTRSGRSLRQRIRNIFQDRGSRYIIGSALISAGAVVITKFLFQYAPPLLYTFYSLLSVLIGITIILFFTGKFRDLRYAPSSLFGIGALFSIVAATHAVGLSLLFSSYFISLKRFSIIFDVLFGHLVHKEDYFRERLIGALFMIVGACCATGGLGWWLGLVLMPLFQW